MIPIGTLAARYFKIWPGQRWPDELDHKGWWHAHRAAQIGGFLLAIVGVALVWLNMAHASPASGVHRIMGWLVMAGGLGQVVSGVLRGSKGAPAALGVARIDGDHYLMTSRRVVFEYVHKGVGYATIGFSVATILLGLSVANAPRWMWIVLLFWWELLLLLGAAWQREGRCIDTYQAIWGAGYVHPGNRRRPIGIAITRYPKS